MDELWRLPATSIAALVRSREIAAREATQSALDRLASANPALNAVVDEFPESALAEADRLDAALARGQDPGPLAGVPVTAKVNVDMAGRATTNGLRLLKDHVAEVDNPCVANLRKAGAVVIGRTNTPAFSLRWFTRNSLHGETLNPHDEGLTPGGSSGGAAAATAAGVGAIGHGTDIAGSIRYPAYACNLHGLRPTSGRIPAANLSSPDRSMGAQITAVSGPLARTMDDLAAAYHAMRAADLRDPWWTPVPHDLGPVPKRAALCTAPEGLATDPAVAQALREAADALAGAGWEVEEVEPPSFRDAVRVNMALWMAEFRASGLPKLEPEGDPDSLFVAARMTAKVAEGADPMDALQARAGLLRAWQLFLDERPVLICPISAEPPFPQRLDVAGEAEFDRVFEAQLTQVALPALGLPGLNVATGRPGAPMGVQLVAGRWREDVLLEAGAAIAAARAPIRPVDPFAA